MSHKKFSTVPRKFIAAALIAVFALLLFLLVLYPHWITAVLCFVISAGMCTMVAFHSEWRAKDVIARLTNEVNELSVNLKEKVYENVSEEEKVFYEALNLAKSSLDKKGKSKQELLEVVNSVASHMEISKLLRDLLPKINEATRSSCSAFYMLNSSTNKLEIKHSVGFSKNVYSEFDMNLGEGMIGSDAVKREITVYSDIPDDTVYFIRTFLGKLKPRSMMVVPIFTQDVPAGVLVCASIYDYTDEHKSMIEIIRHYVGIAVSNSANYDKNRRLTNELTFQNKLIQEQHEQMKGRLGEKTHWLSALLRYIHRDTAFAVDTRGTVVVWNDETVGKNAAGKPIDRVCDEINWPSLSGAVQKALANGSSSEPADGFSFELRCVYNEKKVALGVLVFILK